MNEQNLVKAIAEIERAALTLDELFTASVRRVQELQAAIETKNRYIAALEKQIEPGVLEEIRSELSE